MDWLHFITTTPFENFLFVALCFFIPLLLILRSCLSGLFSHLETQKSEKTKLEIQKGKNLDKQLELEKLRQQLKSNIITPDDIDYSYRGYQQEMQQEQ